MYNSKLKIKVIRRSVELLPNGNYKAKTLLYQKTFINFSGAIQWLAKRGFNVFGQRFIGVK